MGQALDIKAIQTQHYAKGMDLLKEAIEDLYDVDQLDPIGFNFKVKNLFVLPGNISRVILSGDEMIGFFMMSENNIIWNDDKKLSIDFFYTKPEFRNKENMDRVYNYIEDYAFTHKFSSILFNDELPFFADHMRDHTDAVKSSTQYEKEVI